MKMNTTAFYSSYNTSVTQLTYEEEVALFKLSIKGFSDFLYYIDFIVRVYSLVIHVFYFYCVLKLKELQKKEMIYLHHANVISFIFCLHYALYLDNSRPNVGNETLNSFLCYFSECLWSMNKFLRCYSIFLLTLFRFIGVYKIYLYRKITLSSQKIFIPIIIVWIMSLFFYFLLKFAFQTGPGLVLCYDGFSENLELAVWYYAVNSFISVIFPTVAVIFIFCLIRQRLAEVSAKLKKKQMLNALSTISKNNGTKSPIVLKAKVSKNVTTQFCIMIVFVILSSISFLILSITNLIPNINDFYNHYRQMVSIITVFFQSKIPLISILYHPAITKKIDEVFSNKIAPMMHMKKGE
jgi:hypothetical protein